MPALSKCSKRARRRNLDGGQITEVTPALDRPANMLPVVLAGSALVVSSIVLARIGDAAAHIAAASVAYATLAASGLLGAVLLWRRNDRRTIIALVAFALLARAPLIHQSPSLSHDAYRYLWDGRLLLRGIDPYVVPPSAPELHPLRTDWLYQYIDWTRVPSLYPPLALSLFALADRLDDRGTLALKLLVEAGDMGVLTLLLIALRRRELPQGRSALYAWSPLVILEFAQSGHEEAWCLAALLGAIVLLDAGKPVRAGFALGLAALVKLYPLLLVPAFFPRKWFLPTLATVGVVALAYLPFFLWHSNATGFLLAFATRYSFNQTLHAVLGNGGSAVMFLLAVMGALIARRRGADLILTLIWLELAYLLLSPNVYPWYLTVILVLLPLADTLSDARFKPLALGLLGWCTLAPLAYASGIVYPPGSTAELVVRALEYAPLAAGIAAWLLRRRAQRVTTAADSVT